MEKSWIDTFNNKTYFLDNGWFAVKLPDQDQLDLSWDDSREQEHRFFAENEPWKSEVLGDQRNRLGSDQLAQHVSKLLSNLVATRWVSYTYADPLRETHAF